MNHCPQVSVVTPFRGAPQCLELMLGGLRVQTLPADAWEAIIVDDASGMPVDDLVTAARTDINARLVTLTEQRGAGGARNAGAAAAAGGLLIFLDSDVVAAPDLVERHLAKHETGQAEVMLGWRYECGWETIRRASRGDSTPPASELEADLRDTVFGHDSRAPWLSVFGHGLSLQKQLFDHVGGFDEHFVRWGCEDVEFGYRLFVYYGRRSGCIEVCREAYSFHVPHQVNWLGNLQGAGENEWYFKQKHRRYDVELFGSDMPQVVASKIARYDRMIPAFVAHGLGRPPDALASPLAGARALLVVGCDTAALTCPAPRIIHCDHALPQSATNHHLLGTATQLGDGELDAVVNVDIWRLLVPFDLNGMVFESLRVAQRLLLVETKDAPHADCSDVGYLRGMFGHRLSTQAISIPGATVLEICRDGAAPLAWPADTREMTVE